MSEKNKYTFGGNVAREPEVKSYTRGGKEVTYTSLTVANNHPFDKEQKTEFYECQFFGKFDGEVAMKTTKGEYVIVEGTRSWKEGSKGGTFLTLGNATFATGFLPPRKDDAGTPKAPTPPPANRGSAPAANDESDELPF